LLSRDPAPGTPVDEERLEDKLVGAPTMPTPKIDLESDRIFSMHENHGSNAPPLTATIFEKWQSDDATIREIIAGHKRDNPTRDAKSTKSETDPYVLTDGLLHVNVGPHTPIVILKTKSQQVIWMCHDHVLSNYPGWKETYRAVRQRYYWKGQKNYVRLYVGTCHVCACTKPLNSRPTDPMQPRTPKQPWEVISIDLMGPYPRSSKGKSYILVATDCFSRWTEAYPLGTATSKTIIETLKHEFFSRFGYPRVCLSDNGPQSVSNEMSDALDRWGAQGWTTPVYHPRANPVERHNQDIKKGLSAQLVEGKHKSWDTKLPTVKPGRRPPFRGMA